MNKFVASENSLTGGLSASKTLTLLFETSCQTVKNTILLVLNIMLATLAGVCLSLTAW